MSSKQIGILLLFIFVVIGLGSGLLLSDNEASAVEAETAASNGTWPALRHDSGRTGFNPNVGSFRPPFVLLDSFRLGSSNDPLFLNNIITDEERIYVQGQDRFWGIDKEDLSKRWLYDDCSFDLVNPCLISFMGLGATKLVVLKQRLAFPDFGYEVAVINPVDGSELWSKFLGLDFADIAVQGDNIFLLTTENLEDKLTKLTIGGRQLFKKNIEWGTASSRPVVANGRIFYGNGDEILAYSTSTGGFLWRYKDSIRPDNRQYDLVATSNDVIISQGERVIKINASNGIQRWKKSIKPAACTNTLAPNGGATDGVHIAVTSVCDDQVVVLRSTDGGELWRDTIGAVPSPSAIAIGGGILYVASSLPTEFDIWAYDIKDGTLLQKKERDPSNASVVLVLSDGLLLTASQLGSPRVWRWERTPADLSVQILQGEAPICGGMVGGKMTFNFIIKNNGPGTTEDVVAKLSLPKGDHQITTDQGSCGGGNAPTCNLGKLGVNESIQITVKTVFSGDGVFKPGIKLTNSAVRDPNAENDTSVLPRLLTISPLPPGEVDLQVNSLEITQGIQNKANDVRLVEGKQTFVRFYARTDDGKVENVTAILKGRQTGGADFPESPLNPLPITQCVTLNEGGPQREELAETFVFELPSGWWKGDVTLEVVLNPSGAIPDVNPANDSLSISMSYTKLPRVCLKTYPVRTRGRETSGAAITNRLFPDPWALADDDGNILSRALTMLPVSEIKVFPSSHLIEEWEPGIEEQWGPYEMEEDEDNRVDVLDTLDWIWLVTDDPDECDADNSQTHYVGMIHEGTVNSVGSAGLGERPGEDLTLFLNTGANASQAFDDPHGGLTLAHEIGHNYDRPHVNCGTPKPEDTGSYPYEDECAIGPDFPNDYYGLEFLDTTSPTVIAPKDAGDVMSYADDVWTSDYTWGKIQDVLCDANGCSFPAFAPLLTEVIETPPPLTGEVLIIKGRISPSIKIDQAHVLPVTQVPKADAAWAEQVNNRPLTVTYSVNLVNGTTTIYSEPFTPSVIADQNSESSTFTLVIPWDPSTTSVDLVKSGSTVKSLSVSPSPPVVSSIKPNGGETVEDSLDISWTASDADDDELSYTVLYSGDNGSSWQALATGIRSTSITVDSSLLPGSEGQSLVKVFATDGLSSAFRQSANGFTIPNRPPRAIIYFPDDGALYASGSTLLLRGAIYDPEDGYLPSNRLRWNLSGRGALGSGDNIMLDGLESGVYTLTLTGTDGDGQKASKKVKFTIDEPMEMLFLPILTRQ